MAPPETPPRWRRNFGSLTSSIRTLRCELPRWQRFPSKAPIAGILQTIQRDLDGGALDIAVGVVNGVEHLLPDRRIVHQIRKGR